MEKEEAIKIFDGLAKKYNEGVIGQQEFREAALQLGLKIEFYNPKKDPLPKYRDETNQSSRIGFKFNPFSHAKGVFYQNILKPAIVKTIDMIHEYTTKKYDINQFVYDDQRISIIDDFLKSYITNNVGEEGKGRKDVFMFKVVDIIHGTVIKEDIYYRSMYFDFINKFIKTFPDGFPLTNEEKQNLEAWHKNDKKGV